MLSFFLSTAKNDLQSLPEQNVARNFDGKNSLFTLIYQDLPFWYFI